MKKQLKALTILSIAITLSAGLAYSSLASATVPGTNVRVSLTSGGAQASNESYNSSMSADGRFVVFVNAQNNLAGTDTGNDQDVFVRDLGGGTVTRASVSTSGVEASSGAGVPVISQTGRYVVFTSTSTNLIDGRTISSAYQQLYLRDTVSSTTSILSEVSAGTFANDSSIPLGVSADGRFVLFTSNATNLGPTVPSGYSNLFQLDRVAGTFKWVNAQGAGISYGYDTYDAQMSCDGSLIVFDSDATYLGLTYSSHRDVFLFDRRAGDRLTNVTGAANAPAARAKISCNGNYIGFASYANNLDPMTAGMSLDYHAYLYDRVNDQYKLVDQNSSSTIANVRIINLVTDAFFLSLSDKGSAVFGSTATNLDPTSSSGRQLYVRDTVAGTTERLSRDSGGAAGNGDSRSVTVSLDGKLAAYESYATNLVSGDTNSVRDIFTSETGL